MVALETTAAAEETAAKPCSWHEVASAYVRLVLPNICQELTLRDGAKPKSTFLVGAIRAICSSACFSPRIPRPRRSIKRNLILLSASVQGARERAVNVHTPPRDLKSRHTHTAKLRAEARLLTPIHIGAEHMRWGVVPSIFARGMRHA